MKKRILSILLCLCMAFGLLTSVSAVNSNTVFEKMRSNYSSAIRLYVKDNFTGNCGDCVAYQLRALGIANDTYNGNMMYDTFAGQNYTSRSGYKINKYPASGDSLNSQSASKEALRSFLTEVSNKNTSGNYTIIAIGFQKGSDVGGGGGWTYGHTLLIYQVYDGIVYSTDTGKWASRDFSSDEYKTGMAKTIDEFCDRYIVTNNMRYEGAIWFTGSAVSGLHKGNSGAKVKDLQTKLNSVAGAGLTVDGAFGDATRNALINFQKNNGLTPHGIADTTTMDKLNSLLSKSDSPKNGNNNYTPSNPPAAENTTISSPNSTIRYGQRGNLVKDLQLALNSLNSAGLTVDGIFGNATLAAVKAFQSRYGLTVDGIAGPKTNGKINELASSSSGGNSGNGGSSDAPQKTIRISDTNQILRNGSRGAAVTELQNALNSLIGAGLDVDGIYGANTTAAVKAFQSQYGLEADGIAGPKTLSKINEL